MKLCTLLTLLNVAFLALGTPTVEEVYHDVTLLTETCNTGKAKHCAIKPGQRKEGGRYIFTSETSCIRG